MNEFKLNYAQLKYQNKEKHSLYFPKHTNMHTIIPNVLVTQDTIPPLMSNPQQHGDTEELTTQIEHFNMGCESAITDLPYQKSKW